MDLIEKFFDKKLFTNYNTKRNYRRGIELYFKIINKDINTYFKSKQDYEADIAKYFKYLLETTTQMTRKNRINAVRQFLKVYDKKTRDLDIWETISYRLRNIESETEEMALDQHDLKNILQYADIGTKAMFLTMSSCGCRIGELLQLLPEDIYLDETPTRIHFRNEITKTKSKRDSFITPEAKAALEAWLKVRDEYLINSAKKNTSNALRKRIKDKNIDATKSLNDKRIFPMSDVNARSKWETIVRKAGYDERDKKTGRLKAHPHSLRKFFRSYLGNADLAEHIMGHKGYLSTYRQYNTKQLAVEYNKYMSNLSIFETNPDLTYINEELIEKDKEIERLTARVEKLETLNELRLLKKDIHELKNGKK